MANKPNEFTKSTNLFMKAVNTIFKKGDMPMETPPEPNGVGDGKYALVDECLAMLNDGSLPADPQKVQEWATSKGLSEQEAADFAEAILTDYFGNEEDGDELEKGNPPEPEGEPDGDEMESDLQKAALGLSFRMGQIDKKLAQLEKVEKNLEILTKGLTTLLTSNSELVQTNNMMKASLEKLGAIPVSKANPVLSAPGTKPSGIEVMDFKAKKEIVMKGALAGKFSPAEVNLFESSLGTNLTENIKNYILENKAGK